MSRKQEQRRKHLQEQYDNDMRWVMADQRGRRFVQALCDDVGLDKESPFTGNSSTFYKIGQQDLIRGLLRHLRRVALQGVRQMEDESVLSDEITALDRNQPDEPPEA